MNDEATELLRKLVTETNRTLASHAEQMARLSENLTAAHKLAANHGECLVITQQNLEGLTKLVNAQTQGFNVLREVVLKLHTHCFGPDAPDEMTGVVN